jgi:hypothetical protein
VDSSLSQMLGTPELGNAFVDFQVQASPRHLRYMDLVHAPDSKGVPVNEILPDGVLESAGKAAIYIVRRQSLGANNHDEDLAQLTRTLACRADASYLAVVEPGITTVYRLAFYPSGKAPTASTVLYQDPAAGLRALLNGFDAPSKQAAADRLWLDDLLFSLLAQSATEIRDACSVEELDDGQVLSMIGRALFSRFLVDRGIVKMREIDTIAADAQSAEDLFNTVDAAANTFQWLDRTFNGDLLDLGTRDYRALFDQLGASAEVVCRVLSGIMARSSDGQLTLDWGGLQFKHIPVDVLSQVYEHFAHRYSPETAHSTSIHFTPRAIAEVLVDGAFGALPSDQRSSARVLDPAAGAGIFLVLALRRLVAEAWARSGARPARRQIRSIMTGQLCGLDINPQSIKVAALSLYLAALELDPEPQPLSELHFERLFDGTLQCVDAQSQDSLEDAHLGSLSEKLALIGPFDIVLGNPPWTALAGSFKPLLDRIPNSLAGRSSDAVSLVPNQWPDLAFMWRAINWCKPDGVIALLVNARFLFSQDAFEARKLWFSRTRVTGVLNGMALRKEKNIWATNTQAFCAIVAVNQAATDEDSFYFLTPRKEPGLSSRREFRLDPHAANAVPSSLVRSDSTLFKTLSRGTSLDLNLVARLRSASETTFGDLLRIRQGFISRGKGLDDASHLSDLAVIEGPDRPAFSLKALGLARFRDRYPELKIHRPRKDAAIYKGPLLLFREAPKGNVAQRGAVLVDGDIAFSRSFYGASITDTNAPMARYVYVLSYSDLLAYWVLMTSSKFGVERETYHLEDYNSFPMAPYEALTPALQLQAHELSLEIEAGRSPWAAVEKFVAELYNLNRYDLDVIGDALRYEAPYTEVQQRSLQYVTANANCIASFAETLQSILRAAGHGSVDVEPVQDIYDPTWQFVRVRAGVHTKLPIPDDWARLLSEASEPLMSSEIRVQIADQDWLVGRLRRERYWTRSSARLLALDLLERGLLAAARKAA